MESNGSTSMASVCSGMLALMDAGVPIKTPVAGISVGLVTENDEGGNLKRYNLLTDIIGSEDHFGDMDFKLCGTKDGVTGFQLDLKLPGVSHKILGEAIHRAKDARTKILGIMAEALDKPRESLSKYAPRIETIKINPEKIGALIGPGGKTIKGIVAETGAEINIEDDGSVHIYATSGESMARAKEIIGGMTKEIEVGQIYQGRVVSIKEFGAFVEVFPGKDGLVHISELADFRVRRTEDVAKIGEMIWVKCIGIDDKGRVKLSRKAAKWRRAARSAMRRTAVARPNHAVVTAARMAADDGIAASVVVVGDVAANIATTNRGQLATNRNRKLGRTPKTTSLRDSGSGDARSGTRAKFQAALA